MISVVLVDKNDKELGLKEKLATHKTPVLLHRAISIVIFNKNKKYMLITKRSIKKPTWPEAWSNAVCSHPYPNETYEHAAKRRLFEELGIKTKLTKAFKFIYKAQMNNKIWGEHELDYCFVGKYEGKLDPNPDEIMGYEWIEVKNLNKDLRLNPYKYTPWFKVIFRKTTQLF